jgi:hypothetical protein
MTTLSDLHEREEAFINASDRDRLTMLANGQAPATDRVMFLADQTLARAILNQKLGAPPSSALPYKK